MSNEPADTNLSEKNSSGQKLWHSLLINRKPIKLKFNPTALCNLGMIAAVLFIFCYILSSFFHPLAYLGIIFIAVALCIFIPLLIYFTIQIIKEIPNEIRKIITFEEDADETKI